MFSWLLHYLYSFLGIAHKSGRVLFVGLDFAGKTTLLNLLKSGKFSASPPTGQGTAQEITINTGGSEKETLKLTSIDLGGHKQARRVWKDYFFGVDAVIFLVGKSVMLHLKHLMYSFISLAKSDINFSQMQQIGKGFQKQDTNSQESLVTLLY